MRFGLIWPTDLSAGNYRAIYPAMALHRLGHEPVLPAAPGVFDLDALRTCDVVLVYRSYDDATRAAIAQLVEAGVAVVYDNDDDFTQVPEFHPHFERLAGAFELTLEMARLAHGMTATTEAVAARYRDHGIEHVEVIPNLLRFGAVEPGRPHDGVVIGWVGGIEHRQDAELLGLAPTLERLVAKHRDVRVECIGVDLGLPERYVHDEQVPFAELPERMAGWDIGLAPLADLPLNRARSDIKVKEYAARGVAWVASPVGPYAWLGESEGGRLSDPDRWLETLDRLVRKRRERQRLSEAGLAWARKQTIARAMHDWERVLLDAVDRAPSHGLAG
jgi:glycosyltransferase involved in cell wall biosynthesis